MCAAVILKLAWYPDSGHSLILDGSALGNFFSSIIVIFAILDRMREAINTGTPAINATSPYEFTQDGLQALYSLG